MLRLRTYLAPSIPLGFFDLMAGAIAQSLGTEVALQCETRFSGPTPEEPDPFSLNELDLGFMCAPSYRRLRAMAPSPVELLGIAPVPAGPRAARRPVYFADVVVRASNAAGSFLDLRGCRWAYNDATSLSGYECLLRQLDTLRLPLSFVGDLVQSGSHVASLQMVRDGSADAAAIDSTTLALQLAADPSLSEAIRVLESWGPFPVQPIAARRGLDAALTHEIVRALGDIGSERLVQFGFSGFGAVTDADYAF